MGTLPEGPTDLHYRVQDSTGAWSSVLTHTFENKQVITGVEMKSFGGILSGYPNPSAGEITVDLGGEREDITAVITDSRGLMIMKKEFGTTPLIKIDLASLSSGMYYLTVESRGVRATLKIIRK